MCPRLQDLTIHVRCECRTTSVHLVKPSIVSASLTNLDLDVRVEKGFTLDTPRLLFFRLPKIALSRMDLKAVSLPLELAVESKRSPATGATYLYGRFDFSRPSPVKEVVLKGTWRKGVFERFLGNCQQTLRLELKSFVLSNVPMDLLKFISTYMESVEGIHMGGFTRRSYAQAIVVTSELPNLKRLHLSLTEEEHIQLCLDLVKAAPGLRHVKLSAGRSSMEKDLRSLRDSVLRLRRCNHDNHFTFEVV
jgi:hypothetical protein